MNWEAFLAGIGAGVLVGSPIGWLAALVLAWFARRTLAKPTRVTTPARPDASGLRLVKDANERGSAS